MSTFAPVIKLSIALLIAFALLAGKAQLSEQRFVYLTPQDSSLAMIENRLSNEFGKTVKLKRTYRVKSQIGIHETYDAMILSRSVFSGAVKRNRMFNGKTTLSYPIVNFDKVEEIQISRFSNQNLIATEFASINSRKPKWFMMDGNWVPVIHITGAVEEDFVESVYDLSGSKLFTRSLSSQAKPDSLALANVFFPDPITASSGVYGGNLVDSNDANLASLNALLAQDILSIRWNEDSAAWFLESDFSMAADFHIPYGNPPSSKTGDFNFGRGEFGFEYVNAHFHINRQHQHLETLGFGELVNYPILFDSHGFLEDQSEFQPIDSLQGNLKFGDGDVDDAEDADVIVHEYAHAISHCINPFSNYGDQREAIEEGLCDFFALAYSRDISDYQRNLIFNWDGHNEFWVGRELTYSRTYPSDLEGDKYDDAPIWTSTLADISDNVGRDVTEKLLINSIYSYFVGMTMLDAGTLLLQSDTFLFDSEHSEIISIVLCKRGLYGGCEDTTAQQFPLQNPYLGNLQNFAIGSGTLRLFPNNRTIYSCELYDLQGRLRYQTSFENQVLFYELNLPIHTSGVYILRVKTDSGDFSFKVLKL
jgi:hypothetical protein